MPEEKIVKIVDGSLGSRGVSTETVGAQNALITKVVEMPAVNVSASVDTTGLATDTNQTNGSQKTQIVDAGGEAVTVTGGKLDVNATASLAGNALPVTGATEAVAVAIVNAGGDQITSFGGGTQYTEGDIDTTITGTAMLMEGATNTLLPVQGTVADGILVNLGGNNDVTVTGTVTANTGLSQPLTDTQLRASAVKIDPYDTYAFGVKYAGEVYSDGNPGSPAWAVRNDSNSAFSSANGDYSPIAVNDKGALAIQDGGNTITVDGTVAVSNSSFPITDNSGSITVDAPVATPVFVRLSDGATAISTLPVSLASVPSHNVTNAGTFAVQSTNQANSGVDIGDVTINNSTGAAAVNIQDGGNSITVDGSVTADTELTTADLDLGAGSDVRAVVGLVGSKSGGAQLIPGDATAGLKVDLGADNDVTVTNSTATNLKAQAETYQGGTAVGAANPLQVTLANGTVPSHAVTNAGTFAVQSTNQANSGVDIGDVTINNGAGVNAVNIQDGGNAITVDGTVAVTNAGITTIAGAVAGTEMQVDVLTMPTVTANATLAAETTKVIGTVNIAASQTVGLASGTNGIGKLTANSGVDIGDVDILSIAAGDNNIGNVDVLTIAAGTNAIGNVGIIPRTTGGLTTYHLVSAATTNAAVVKASAGQLFGWYIYNSNAAARKVAFHNSASSPTAGASVFFTIVVPPTAGANVFSETGIAFSSGIAITTTTGLADNDSAAVAANDLIINLFYA